MKKKKINIPQIILEIILICAGVAALLPIILTFIVSISSDQSVINNGYSFFPEEFSLDAYRFLFRDGQIIDSYIVTIVITIAGVAFGLILTAMTAFALSSPKVKYRQQIAFLFYIPMVFNSGMVSYYLTVTKTLGLRNSIWVLILPSLVSSYNIFLMRNYFKSIPASLVESAEIDGATPFIIFKDIILPTSTPIIATVSLFVGLGYWNKWSECLWFIDDKKLWTLQYLLFQIKDSITEAATSTTFAGEIPTQTVQMASMFISIGPIVLLYPFVQKYFVKGIMVGAVKG